MSDVAQHRVIRSYTEVFRIRRRTYRIGDAKVPLPQGIELRAFGYAAAVWVGLFLLTRLPLIGTVYGLIPTLIGWLLLPGLVTAGLLRFEYEGRGPHFIAMALVRFLAQPRWIVFLRRAPKPGSFASPIDSFTIDPDMSGVRFRPGRAVNPGLVIIRQQAAIHQDDANKLVIITPTKEVRRLREGKVPRVPEDYDLIVTDPK